MDTVVTALHPEPSEQLEHNTREIESALAHLDLRDPDSDPPQPPALVAL